MEKGKHGKNEEKFEELTYAGQAKVLNAQILLIKKGFEAHFRKGKTLGKELEILETKKKYKNQLINLIKLLE